MSKNKIIKLLLLFGILAMGSAVVLTFIRTLYLALGISFIVMGCFFFVSKGKNFFKENKKIFIILLIIIILITVLFTISTSLSKKDTIISKIKERASIAQIVNEFSSGRRAAIWKYTIPMIDD